MSQEVGHRCYCDISHLSQHQSTFTTTQNNNNNLQLFDQDSPRWSCLWFVLWLSCVCRSLGMAIRPDTGVLFLANADIAHSAITMVCNPISLSLSLSVSLSVVCRLVALSHLISCMASRVVVTVLAKWLANLSRHLHREASQQHWPATSIRPGIQPARLCAVCVGPEHRRGFGI
jgi:hypothetical protein